MESNDNRSRPIGYWLRAVDALISREFAAAFEGEGVTRRDWMLLNAVAGDVDVPGLAERLARKGKRLRTLEDRGWVDQQVDGTWVLTDAGREAKERLGAIVDGVRARVAGAVSPDDFATTLTSLEAIARELGWDESMRMPRPGRRFGRGHGFGPGHGFGDGHGFGPGHGRGRGHGFGPGHGHGHGCHGAHHAHAEHGHYAHAGHGQYGDSGHGRSPYGHSGHGHHGAGREQAYERGFDAGYARGVAERD
jgi:hypothetical protein